MRISRVVTGLGTLLSLLVLLEANAETSRPKDLICDGTVTYGHKTFSDQVTLRFSSEGVEVGGKAGMVSTFEGMLKYRICAQTESELNFEYSTSPKCGGNATRTGRLHKTAGNLRLTRSDRGDTFVGDYKCKPA